MLYMVILIILIIGSNLNKVECKYCCSNSCIFRKFCSNLNKVECKFSNCTSYQIKKPSSNLNKVECK